MLFKKKNSNLSKTFQKEDYNAKIEIGGKIRFVRAASTINIPITITNLSKSIFPAFTENEKNPVNLSYHWLDEKKNVVEFKGVRTFLPHDLEPNEKITLYAIVRAIDEPGDYFLEFDLAKEGISWFKDKNSTSLIIPVRVLGKDLFNKSFWFPEIKQNFANFHHIFGAITKASFSEEKNSRVLNMAGWMLSTVNGAPVDSISFLLDSTFLDVATLGDENEAFATQSSEYLKCGWHGKIELPVLKQGYHLLEIFVRSGHELFPVNNTNVMMFVKENGKISIMDEFNIPFSNPLPPSNLMNLVAATDNKTPFIKSGAMGAYSLERALKSIGKSFDEFKSVLDFGCGCGRVIMHLQRYTKTKFFGTDYDPNLIEWCKKNLPFANFKTNSSKPPLTYENGMFDLVYAFSILTHMTVETQKQWIRELTRIVKDGGFLLLSTGGDYGRGTILNNRQRQRFDNGNIVVKNPLDEGKTQCQSRHPFGSITKILPDNLKLINCIYEGAKGNPRQDLNLLQKFP